MTANPPSPRHRSRAGLALLAAVAVTSTLTACGTAPVPPTPVSAAADQTRAALTDTTSSQKARLTALAQQDVGAGAPGVIVRVDNGHGQPIEIARQAPWTRTDHTLTASDEFRMGSNTKTMVATVILQLVAEHRLELTDPVQKWLPGLIPDGTAITIRMLLNHTSGLFNYVQDPDGLKAFTGQDATVWTPRQLIAAAVRHAPLFAPGTNYSYSNTNYIALGMIAEKATGHTLDDLIQERIAEPLHLKNTHLATGADTTNRPGLAHGYEPDADHIAGLLPDYAPPGTAFAGPARPEGHVDTTWINPSAQWAAGAMVSTAQDWARFDKALLSGKLLPPTLLHEMRTTVAEESEFPNRRYGLGLEQVTTPCGTVWGHSGQVPGYSSEAYTDATGRRTVSVLTTTIFGLATPKAGAANRALVNAAVCAMIDKPTPATSTSPTG